MGVPSVVVRSGSIAFPFFLTGFGRVILSVAKDLFDEVSRLAQEILRYAQDDARWDSTEPTVVG